MGGNVFKDQSPRRLSKEEYKLFCKQFFTIFFDAFGFNPILIKAYANKDNFGDADFLVPSKQLPPDWLTTLRQTFSLSSNQYSKNGSVVSIFIDNFQVDLIVTDDDIIPFAEFYFGYNDFGNLIGRIGHKLGIKIGHRGLSLIIREHQNHVIKEICFSDYPETALNILGLSISRYKQGFDNLEDIFEYVASSKYFDAEIYEFEHRSNKARVRDKKRPTYNKFLTWIAETNPKSNHSFADKSEKGGYGLRHPYYEDEVLSRFSWVEDEVKAAIDAYHFNEQFRAVFNGDNISDISGYAGKELGAFIAYMRESLTNDMKHEFVNDHRAARHFIVSKLWSYRQ